MLFPKKVKYRKWQIGRENPNKVSPATRGNKIDFGSFGLKATSGSRISSNQIESARKAMTRHATKQAKIWVRIFPDKPITAKPAEMGMGKGKGDLKGYVFEVRPGRVIFEIDGISEEQAREALRKAGTKLSCKTKVVAREW